MRSLSAVLTFSLIACTLAATAQHAKAKSKGMGMDMTMPYTAQYSSKFQIGDPKYSAIVLNAWKAYDDNTLDSAMGMLADTVTAFLPDGSTMKGKEAFMSGIKAFRGGFTTVKSQVVAYMSVKSIDKGDNLVFIWGDETDTKGDSTTTKMDLHEVWGFNKDGKVDFFKQFMSQQPKEGQ